VRSVVFVLSVGAAGLLGLGWVLQQRVAVRSLSSQLLSWSLVGDLIRTWTWWGGIAAMAAGQSLSAWALQLGPLTVVEPLLASSLLFAFVISAIQAHERVRWQELVGGLVLSGSLAAFLGVAQPIANRSPLSERSAVLIGAVAIAVVAAAVAVTGRLTGSLAAECVLLAAAAGTLYGLQDAATRAAIVAVRHHRLTDLLTMPWPYLVLAAATAGVLCSQSAFRAGRLDYALPPTAAAQALCGIALGVGVLGDRIAVSAPRGATELLSLLALLAGTILIARSPALRT
jgi:hypothetical protein